jgi:hypothetical protein
MADASSDTLEVVVAALGVAVAGLISVCGFLMVRDTIRKSGEWGLNLHLRLPNCGRCGSEAPLVRNPANLPQTLWGGWTCNECGLEMDKWGVPVDPSNQA